MNVFLKPFSGKVYKNNAIFRSQNGDNIFFDFDKKMVKQGVTINTLDIGGVRGSDIIVFCDIPYFWELNYWRYLLFSRNQKVLFTFESPLVNPFSHIKLFYGLFNRVYSWNDNLVNHKEVKKLFLPILETNMSRKPRPLAKRKLISVINSNKSIPYPFKVLSKFKHDLYPERVKAINFLEKSIPKEFDLYGRGWNAPKKFSFIENLIGYKTYKSYRGAIARDASSKVRVLSAYKFNLCFENCVADGYVSEKIFDCFKAGTVPIYLGAPNIDKFLPTSSFIDFRKFAGYKQLLEFITNMSDKEIAKYVKAGQRVLKEKKILDNWFESGFTSFFLRALRQPSL